MNWCSSQLEKMIILGDSLCSMACDFGEMISTCDNEERRPSMKINKLTYVGDRLRYVWAIRKHTWEFDINDESLSIDESPEEHYSPEQIFQNMCWHGFDFDGIDIIEKDMNNFLPSTDSCFKWVDDETSYPYRMDEDDLEELPRLQYEMDIIIMELRQSEHYCTFRNQLYNNQLLKNEISHRLASTEQIQMVIYGLGPLEHSLDSHYQLALALLLKEEIDMLKIGEIQVYDPLITPVDAALIRSFGCTVLSVNEYARRRVEKPMMFFLPFAPYGLLANILETNWSPFNLENIIILGPSLHRFDELSDQPDYGIFEQTEIERLMENDRRRYKRSIKDWTVYFIVDKEDFQMPFNQFYWIFFNLPPNYDMKSILPSFPTLSKIQVDHENAIPDDDPISELRINMESSYFRKFKLDNKRKNSFFSFRDDMRGLSKYRKAWTQSQPNWIKLNFDGHCGEASGYGGFFSNDEREILLSYAGPMNNSGKDLISAQVEGLREGVRCFKQLLPDSCHNSYLIIESSALSVIRWANELLPPPHKFLEIFEEMCAMLEETNCVVQHVYEEANTKANELAKLGMTLPQFSSWGK